MHCSWLRCIAYKRCSNDSDTAPLPNMAKTPVKYAVS